jgi:DNA-binding CsgD family transcriptional regulator
MLAEQELSDLIGVLYDAAADPVIWTLFLRRLADITHAKCAGLFTCDAARHSTAHSWEVDPEMVRLHREYYGSVDVWWVRGGSLAAGSVRTSESLCPVSELRTTETYNDCLSRFDIEHGLFALAENSGPLSGSVSLFRSSRSGPFQTAEVETLSFLAPHLHRAFRLSRQFSDLKARATGIEEALNMVSAGVVLLGARGEIILMNRAASALILEKNGLLVTREGLRAELPSESTLLVGAIEQALLTSNGRGLSVGGIVLVSRRRQPHLQLLVSPVHMAMGLSKTSAVVFIDAPRSRRRPAEAVLRTIYGFTPAECRVALLLSDGQPPQEIARLIGVTNHTVRSQIKSIFSKTGVRRQAELVRLLLSNASPVV